MSPFDPPEDLNARREELIALWHDHERLKNEFEAQTELKAKLEAQVAQLQQKLTALNKRHFSGGSERRPHDKGKEAKPKALQTGHGPHGQPQLPAEDVVHDLDEPDQVCKACGGQLVEWPDQFDDSEEIDVAERTVVLKRHRRKKYRCSCGACVETALGPQKWLPGGRYSLDFALAVATDKYERHLPLERQVRHFAQQGLVVESQTLWDQLNALAHVLEPVYAALTSYARSGTWVGADETTWPLLEHAHAKDKAGTWWAWMLCRPDAVVYQIEEGRGQTQAIALVGDFAGTVLCDGLGAYQALAKRNPRVKLAHCWVHARREFLEAESAFPTESRWMLGKIAELYLLEPQAPKGPAGDAVRQQIRAQQSQRVLDEIEAWVWENGLKSPPQSPLRKALGYLANRWAGLCRFVREPFLPLDNNATEREARAVALGRKNHYGSRSKRGTEVAAQLYSLVESAKLSGVEPRAYLKLAVTRAQTGQSVVLPHEVTAEHLVETLGWPRERAEQALSLRSSRS